MRLGWLVIFHINVLKSRRNAIDVILVAFVFDLCFIFPLFNLFFGFRGFFILFFILYRRRLFGNWRSFFWLLFPSFFDFLCFYRFVFFWFNLFIVFRRFSFLYLFRSFWRTFVVLFVFTLTKVSWVSALSEPIFHTSVAETSPGFSSSSSSSVAAWRTFGTSSSPSERSSSFLRLRAAIFVIGIWPHWFS